MRYRPDGNPRTEKKLIGCGANKVVLPTAIGATKFAQLIIRLTAENILEQITHQSNINEELNRIGLQFHELAVASDSPLANRTLSHIELRSNHGFLIVALRRTDGSTQLNPSPETKLDAGDVVIVFGHHDDMPQLAAKFSARGPQLTYRGVSVNP